MPRPARDYFSEQAAAYAAFRPGYPAALFAYLATLPQRRRTAWDCATGSGQAALGVAPHFEHVIATDLSAAQLAHAASHPRIEYRVAPAEASGLDRGSIDLVSVAQALHWFDLDAFYAEVRRVLAPGGAIAVWSYGDPVLAAPAADAVLQNFNRDVVGPYWPTERHAVGEGYRSLPFPFVQERPPVFTLEREWTLAPLVGYLGTWSATVRYAAERGHDPVALIAPALRAAWGEPDRTIGVRWPLTLLVGR